MSLIQEALKRQQEDAEKHATESPPPVQSPATAEPGSERVSVRRSAGSAQTENQPPAGQQGPPPLPGEVLEAGPVKRNRAALLGIAAVILLVIGGGVWLALFFMKPKNAAQPPPTTSTTLPASVAGSTPTVEPAVTAPPPVVVSVTPPVETVAVVTATEPTPSGTKIETAATPPPPAHVAPPAPVVWPSLMLSGVMGRGSRGAVRINNEIVTINDTIQGVKLIAIGNQGVELEYMGERKILKVGSSTQ
jgi:hypothetical protein